MKLNEAARMLNEVSLDVLKKLIKNKKFDDLLQSTKDPDKNIIGGQQLVTLGITDNGESISPEVAYEELMAVVVKNKLNISPNNMKELVTGLVDDKEAVSPHTVEQWKKALQNS